MREREARREIEDRETGDDGKSPGERRDQMVPEQFSERHRDRRFFLQGFGEVRRLADLEPHPQPQPDKHRRQQEWNADRKSVVKGKRGSVRVDLGGRSIIKKKKK